MFKSVLGLVAVLCFLTFSFMFNCYSLYQPLEITPSGDLLINGYYGGDITKSCG